MDKHIEEKLYTAASNLFEKDTVLDLDKDEYVRGMAEIMAAFLLADKFRWVDNIHKRRGASQLTDKDFIESPDRGLLYIGPLDVARDFIKGPNKTEVAVFRTNTGRWRVEFDGGHVFGVADTEELAWRYALGGEFGPIDEGFVPFTIHR